MCKPCRCICLARTDFFCNGIISYYSLCPCPAAEVPIFRISVNAFASSSERLALKSCLPERISRAILIKLSNSIVVAVLLVFGITGSNSNAPMPRFPVKHSSSTGFMLLAGRPFLASQAFIMLLPYLSGNTSASRPGRPLNVLERKIYVLPHPTPAFSGGRGPARRPGMTVQTQKTLSP